MVRGCGARNLSWGHSTGCARGRAGTGSAEGGRQESVVDQVLVGGGVGADPPVPRRGGEELLEVAGDVVRRSSEPDHVGHGADEVSREVRVDDGLGAGACGWRRAAYAAQDPGAVGVAAELVLG